MICICINIETNRMGRMHLIEREDFGLLLGSVMELIVIVLSFVLFMYAVVKLVRVSGNKSSNVIPGPRKLPLIGNLHLLSGKSLPHHVFRELGVKHGGLMRLQLGEVPFMIVSSVEVAKQVFRTHDITFSNRFPTVASSILSYNYRDVAVAPYGHHWRQVRKVCTLELLSARRVKSFRPIREEENLNLAKSIASCAASGSPVNLSEKLHLNSFDIITRSSVGDKAEEQAKFTWAIEETMKLSSGLSVVDLFPSNRLLPLITGVEFKFKRIFRLTDGILQSIIDRHRGDAKGRSEDLVDVLLKYQQSDAEFHLTDDDIKAVILDMFFAGSETSSTAVGWAMSEMMRNPSTLKRAQDQVRQVFDSKGSYVDEAEFGELKYMKLVIDETLRLHPPLPLLVPRMSSERCEINGYEIPAKTRVIINAWALGRDPKYWNDADKFIPERFEDSSIDYKGNHFEYIPFGSGRRICPGISMGLTNVEYMLATLLYHFDWEMPFPIKNQPLDMTEAFGVTAKRKHDLLLIPTIARPLPTTFNH